MSALCGHALARTHVGHTGSKHWVLRAIMRFVGIPSVIFGRKDASRPWIQKHRGSGTESDLAAYGPPGVGIVHPSTAPANKGGSSTEHGQRMDLRSHELLACTRSPSPNPPPPTPTVWQGWDGGGGAGRRRRSSNVYKSNSEFLAIHDLFQDIEEVAGGKDQL